MPPAVPATEPKTFSAGDTVKWTKSLNDYPSIDGWALSYAFRGEKGDGRLDVNATGGDAYAITIAATDSGLMRPGTWVWHSYVTRAGERYTIGQGTTIVEPNLAVTNFATDLRSSVKKAYDNARDAMETFAKTKMTVLNGRTYTARDYADLKKYVDDCTAAYVQEVQEAEAVAGGGDPRKIYVLLNRYQ